MISVLVLTIDEAVNLKRCLESTPWRDDVHVLDSGSADGTVDLAKSLGAHVHYRRFTTYSEQRNAGLALPFKHSWLLMLDADEQVTLELAGEIEDFIETAPATYSMAIMRRKDMFLDRWLRRSSGYPSWFPRLFRVGSVRVERAINEEYVADGERHKLRGHLVHYPMAKGLDYWFERHNRYSRMEAEVLAKERLGRPIRFSHLYDSDPLLRRAATKRIAYSLPARPFLMFLYLYILRGGFLDGRPGYIFATMRLAYELMIDAKTEVNATARHKKLSSSAEQDSD